jgi:photosystem II stability/assembly factor-like uncharacterized protein
MLKLQLVIFWGLLICGIGSTTDLSWEQLNGPFGGRIVAQAFHENGGHFALFDHSLHLSTGSDSQWQMVFDDVVAFQIGSDDLVYVQSKDGLYFSQSGRSSWNKLPDSNYNLDLDRMAIGANGILYFADTANLFVSTDRSLSWQIVDYNFDNSAHYVKFSESGDLYVFGNNKVFHFSSVSSSWNTILDASANIQELFITNSDQVFVAVGDETSGTLFKSTDTGTTWHTASLPYAKKLFEAPQGWLFGAGGTLENPSASNSFISLNGGGSWSPIDINGPIYNFAVNADGDIFIGSDGLFRSTNSGGSFQSIAPNRAHVYAVVSTSDNNLFAVTATDSSFWRFWRSADSGINWSEIDKKRSLNDPDTFSALKLVQDDRIWLVLGYQTDADAAIDKNVIYETTDGGASWSVLREILSESVSIDFDKHTNTCYAWSRGAKYFHRSEDIGETWEPIPVSYEFGALHAASHGLLYGYSKSEVEKISQLYYSFDSGEPGSWNSVDVASEDGVSHLYVDHLGILYKLISQQVDGDCTLKRMYRSTNYGQKWVDIKPDSGLATCASTVSPAISFDRLGGLYLWTDDYVLLSRNAGLDWQEIYGADPIDSDIQCLFPTANGEIFAGFSSSSIHHAEKPDYAFLPAMFDGLENPVASTYGVVWIDYDVDGYEDVFVVNDGVNYLYRNTGDGNFRKVTSGEIVTDNAPSRGASWADYNNDGLPDCYVTNWNAQNNLYKNLGGGAFKKITSGNIVEDIGEFRSCSWIDVNNDGHLDIYLANVSGKNILYVNDGTNHFTKFKPDAVGEENDVTYGIGWCDFDKDGDQDIYLANGGVDRLYEQTGNLVFQAVGDNRIPPNTGIAVGCSWGDYDSDGWMDLLIANADKANIVFRNNRNGSFSRAYPEGIATDVGVSKGSAWADHDNDGDLDLFVANNGSHFFYSNDGQGGFEKESMQEFIYYGGNCLSAAWGDKDNDGDADLVLASYDLQTLQYENIKSNQNWLKVKCIGTMSVTDVNVGNKSNRSAIGARIQMRATVGGKSIWQVREISGQTGHAGQNSLVQHFGVGDATQIDSLIVYWPSGKVQRLAGIGVNRRVTVLEASTSAVAEKQETAIPVEFDLGKNYPNPFNPMTTIHYAVSRESSVKIEIIDTRGRLIRTVRHENHTPGFYSVMWDGRDDGGRAAASGLYFGVMTADDFYASTKMTLLR